MKAWHIGTLILGAVGVLLAEYIIYKRSGVAGTCSFWDRITGQC